MREGVCLDILLINACIASVGDDLFHTLVVLGFGGGKILVAGYQAEVEDRYIGGDVDLRCAGYG